MRSLLADTEPMQRLRDQSPDRFARLEALLATADDGASGWDSRALFFPGASRESQRLALAAKVTSSLQSAPAGRLISLLGQALKWQRAQGSLPPGWTLDVFRDRALPVSADICRTPAQRHRAIAFPPASHAESAVFSGDGVSLVTGSVDGFVEVWSWATGSLRMDLQYQADVSIEGPPSHLSSADPMPP